jgi:hypothetical protein
MSTVRICKNTLRKIRWSPEPLTPNSNVLLYTTVADTNPQIPIMILLRGLYMNRNNSYSCTLSLLSVASGLGEGTTVLIVVAVVVVLWMGLRSTTNTNERGNMDTCVKMERIPANRVESLPPCFTTTSFLASK